MRVFILLGIVLLMLPATLLAQGMEALDVTSTELDIQSGGQAYESYLAAPSEEGVYPGIVLIHSFRGMEEGYRTMTDAFAAQGFVVLAVGWQTFEQSPADDTVEQLLLDSIATLSERPDVDPDRLGLTGFCAGGRYTMLFLPQIEAFGAGVAWYGFPYGGDTPPADVIETLEAPMLIIHGTADAPSPIDDIYSYASALTDAGKYFELNIYYGEPHGFMLENSQLRQDDNAADAFDAMVRFFQRKLG